MSCIFTISKQDSRYPICQSLSRLSHHEQYLLTDKPCLHNLSLYTNITGRWQISSLKWYKIRSPTVNGGSLFFLLVYIFISYKLLEYICIENYKTIYKYMQLQGNRNGHSNSPRAHTPSFMTFIILPNFNRSDVFITVIMCSNLRRSGLFLK